LKEKKALFLQKKTMPNLQEQSFYKLLQSEMPDNRSVIGRKHELAFVLTGFVLGILNRRESQLSIVRYMKNNLSFLCELTNQKVPKSVSAPQLGRILRSVNLLKLNELCIQSFGKEILQLTNSEWVALDGKELRGTIESEKSTRGEALVYAVSHQTGAVVQQTFYQGNKESEKIAVRKLLEESGLQGKSVTFDALHCDPTTLSQLERNQGIYLTQAKDNQEDLVKNLKSKERRFQPVYTRKTVEKGHGRLEIRNHQVYNIENELFGKRWDESHLRTLIVVERETTVLKTKKVMKETSYYITNRSAMVETETVGLDLTNAVRGHWSIEASNYRRDVTFNEDHIRIRNSNAARVYAVLLSLAMSCLNQIPFSNTVEQLEHFIDSKSHFALFLSQIGFV
jgi:predicted transposase YbfD/YdcC